MGEIILYLKRYCGKMELMEGELGLTDVVFYLFGERSQVITDLVPHSIKLNQIREGSTITLLELLNQTGKAKLRGGYVQKWEE